LHKKNVHSILLSFAPICKRIRLFNRNGMSKEMLDGSQGKLV
jgi:hypothetical protein